MAEEARLAFLRAEVGAFLGSGVLTRALGMVVGEGGHPWHHFGSSVAGVEELLPGWGGHGLGEVAYYSVKRGRLRWAEEAPGLWQALESSYAKNCVSVAAQGLTHSWDWRVHWGPQEAGGKAAEEEPETGHLVPI